MRISEILSSLLCYPELCWVSVMLSVWMQMAAVSSDWVRMHASNLTTAVKVISNKTRFSFLTRKSKWMKLCLCQSSKYSQSCLMICAMSSSVVECMFHTLSNKVLPSTLQVEKIVWMNWLLFICLSFNMFRVLWKIQNLSSYTNQNRNILIRN